MDNLVFIHGFLSGRDYWHKQKILSKHANLFFVDLPGFGRVSNDEACVSIADFAKAAHQQIDQAGIRKFHLIGHSMGGMTAQELVRQIPDRVDKLVLYGTGADGSMPGRFEPIEISIAKLNRDTLKTDMENTVASWFLDRDKNPDYPSALELAQKASYETFRSCLLAMNSWNNEKNLASIRQQTLVLWGDKDRSYRFEQPYQLWTEIPNSNLAVIPNSAHNTHLEKHELFNHMVIDFLELGVGDK